MLAGASLPARADLKLCNLTPSRVGVALGYADQQGWASEGWWNIAANACETLLKGPLIARWYYIYAVDYDQGGSWGGPAKMCTRDKLFTIRGHTSCQERGYNETGFFEVDTGENLDWTIKLEGAKTTAGTGAAHPVARRFPPHNLRHPAGCWRQPPHHARNKVP